MSRQQVDFLAANQSLYISDAPERLRQAKMQRRSAPQVVAISINIAAYVSLRRECVTTTKKSPVIFGGILHHFLIAMLHPKLPDPGRYQQKTNIEGDGVAE